MKKKLILFILMTIIFSAVRGQIVADYTFTAELNGIHKPLDSIYIANTTRGVDTMLYGNDTVLTVYSSIGVNDGIYKTSNELILYPNYPNPFSNSTTVWFYLPENNSVLLKVFDITGREIAIHEQFLQRGHHYFKFNSGGESFYLLTVEAGDQRKVQKLINISSIIGEAGIEYTGQESETRTHSWRTDKKSKSGFSWYPGDSMRFIGYVAQSEIIVLADTIEDTPVQSVIYTFQYYVPPPPVADFIAGDTVVYATDTIFFTDISTGNPTSWHWDFGDGSKSVQQNPYHVYTVSGNFNIRLIVSNSGGYDTLEKINYIQVACLPGAYPVYDIDCNGYDTVHIGTQVWLKQNLRTTRYNDGTPIPNITSDASWMVMNTGAFCYYNNDSASYSAVYGALYNGHAALQANLCPVGWHVPAVIEFDILADYLGGMAVAGGHLKEVGTVHWLPPNTGATNSSGFTALPGGSRNNNGFFQNMSYAGGWWSSSETPISNIIWGRILAFNNTNITYTHNNGRYGYSIRCLQD